ncbi:CPBP family intramembrane metalloprotease [Bacillus sp. N1-1]|nr:CPBP family intramembrane metalloprotease [Bacillus sp. N1-1]
MLIITPVFEELMFRVPLSIWMNRRSYFIFALLVSSIIFGMMHSEYPLFGVILGIVFGIVYRLTKSIVPGIIVHFLWNLFSLYYFNYI